MELMGVSYFAVMCLLVATQGWLMLSDFGIGSSLQNYVAERRAAGEGYQALLAGGGCVLFIIILVLYGLWSLSYQYIASIMFKNISGVDYDIISMALLYSGLFMILSGCAQVIYKVWLGEHKGHLAFMFPAIAQLIGYVGIVLLDSTGSSEGELFIWITFLWFAPVALISLTGCLWAMFCQKVWQVSFKGVVDGIKTVAPRAFGFSCFSFMVAGVLLTDMFVLSILGPDNQLAVGLSSYYIAHRIFFSLFFVYSAALSIIVPTMTIYISQRENESLRLLVKMLIGTGVAGVIAGSILLWLIMPFVISLVSSQDKVIISDLMVFMFCIYLCVRVWTDTWSGVLQSASRLAPFWRAVPVQVLVSILLMCLFASKWGGEGLVLGITLSYLITVAWYLPMSAVRFINFNETRSAGGV